MSDEGGVRTNPELEALHRSLVALGARLEASLDDAADEATVNRIEDEISDVAARVTAVGAVLLTRRTLEISAMANAVAAQTPRIEAEIAELGKLEAALSGVAAVLDTVDRIVAMAAV